MVREEVASLAPPSVQCSGCKENAHQRGIWFTGKYGTWALVQWECRRIKYLSHFPGDDMQMSSIELALGNTAVGAKFVLEHTRGSCEFKAVAL